MEEPPEEHESDVHLGETEGDDGANDGGHRPLHGASREDGRGWQGGRGQANLARSVQVL